jgi:hypothetical protein
MAETAAQRFARDLGYRELAGDANHEAGTARAVRNFKYVPDERSLRQYAVEGGGSSALEDYIDTIQ